MTKIEWTNETWNPVTGCTKVSAGCRNCYAERLWPRLSAPNMPYEGRKFTDVQCHPERLEQPLRWKRPRRIFVNSMSDLFHEDVPLEFLFEVFAVMERSRNHVFQILTKRAARMKVFMQMSERYVRDICSKDLQSWPPKNVWLGVSVENHETANERIPHLLDTPAAVRFLSVEPMLESIYVSDYFWGTETPCDGCPKDADCSCGYKTRKENNLPSIDWVIVGGESGPKARPMDLDWARSLREQCRAAGVPFFMKQLSQGKDFKKFETFPEDLQAREWPE